MKTKMAQTAKSVKISPRAKAAINWLVTQRREANVNGFHSFECREDRRLTPFIVVCWFQKHCPELNAHHDGKRVFLAVKQNHATR